tara:strand:- start:14 stop:1087 length:1074 start_codon:yes stop_codon:yes gene_type:complete
MSRASISFEGLPGYAEWQERCERSNRTGTDSLEVADTEQSDPNIASDALQTWYKRAKLSTAAWDMTHPFLIFRQQVFKKFADWAAGKKVENVIELQHETPIESILNHMIKYETISHVYEAKDNTFFFSKNDLTAVKTDEFDISYSRIPRSKKEGLDFAALYAANETRPCACPGGASLLVDAGTIQRGGVEQAKVHEALAKIVEMLHARAVAVNSYSIYNSLIYPIVNGTADGTAEMAAREVLSAANFIHQFFDKRWLFFGQTLSLHKHSMPRDYLPWEVHMPQLYATKPDSIENEYKTISIADDFLKSQDVHRTFGMSIISVLMASLLCAIPLTDIELRYLIEASNSICLPSPPSNK